MLPIIFFVPVVQLIILVHAATFEMKNIKLALIDYDLSSSSRKLVAKFEGSPFFNLIRQTFSRSEGENMLVDGTADAVLIIPYNFEKKLVNENNGKVQLVINAINGTSAALINAYSTNVIANYNRELNSSRPPIQLTSILPKKINYTYSHWYNPELNYKVFMVPGILVLLITIISFMLSGMNIVREKEIGTIEQINVTPIKKWHFIAGKLLPFWILALAELAFGMVIGKLLFNIPITGSIVLIFFSAAIYIVSILAMGLFVSTITYTQQQSMFITFFFMMIFVLMSGLFTSIESMPGWAQIIDKFNPVAYIIRIMRMIMLKGSGITDIRTELLSLLGLSSIMLTLAVLRYRKVS
jgi:ABC-2 type transport system permease protein